MEITQTTRVGELASQFPATIKVFQEHGVDFCCGGQRPLGDVCGEGGPGFEALRVELARAIAGAAPDATPLGEHAARRADGAHRRAVPRLDPAGARPRAADDGEGAARSTGSAIPSSPRSRACSPSSRPTSLPHMMKEERVLFPFIAAMAAAPAGATIVVPFGTVQNPIRMMEMEHEAVGGLLARMRDAHERLHSAGGCLQHVSRAVSCVRRDRARHPRAHPRGEQHPPPAGDRARGAVARVADRVTRAGGPVKAPSGGTGAHVALGTSRSRSASRPGVSSAPSPRTSASASASRPARRPSSSRRPSCSARWRACRPACSRTGGARASSFRC